jgi:Putative auto-transporter adhesin, head GIN domain
VKFFSVQAYGFIVAQFVSAVACAQNLTPFSAATVDFSGFVGKIRIEPSADKTINLQLRRGDTALLKTRMHQGVVYISYVPKMEPSEATGYGGNTYPTRAGLIANQNAASGGKKYFSAKTKEMAELIVTAPIHVSLQTKGFVGDASIDAMSGPADLSVTEGRINAKRLGPARLRVKGAGDIVLDEAGGEVRLSIDGAGDIHVKGGNVDRAWADVNGVGNIRYTGGRIQQAYISARGTSSITMDGVVKVSKGVIEGTSEVEINSLTSGK